jgi:flagellar M-ring protein FliF
MRTDIPSHPAPTLGRVRAEFARTRRRFEAQPKATRWSLGLGALAIVVTVGYAATGATFTSIFGATASTTSGVYLRSGQRFSSDDLVTIKQALDAKHLRYRVDGQSRVEVAIDRLDEADETISKLPVGPRTFSEIERRALESSIWDTSSVREQRLEQAANDWLAAMIQPMDGIVSANVRIKRARPRGLARATAAATAFVYLETEDDREIASATVESIRALISRAEPDVKPDAVSVFDRKGRHYADAYNPTLGAQVRNRARGEELRQKIADELTFLKGVQVSVQLVPVTIPGPGPGTIPLPLPPLPAASAADEINLPPLAMGVNRPLDLAGADPTPKLPPAPSPTAAAVTPTPPATEPAAPPKARVWVKVPRSYYLRAMPRRDPSLEDLQPLVERTRLVIETAVKHVVPPDQFEEVVISTIPDELPAQEVAGGPASTDARRALAWWAPAGIGGGLTAVVLAVGFGVLASRRPAPHPSARPREDRARYKIDEASDPGPGPSERVRELIRLNPEAAASVLHRSTGQGGTIG